MMISIMKGIDDEDILKDILLNYSLPKPGTIRKRSDRHRKWSACDRYPVVVDDLFDDNSI